MCLKFIIIENVVGENICQFIYHFHHKIKDPMCFCISTKHYIISLISTFNQWISCKIYCIFLNFLILNKLTDIFNNIKKIHKHTCITIKQNNVKKIILNFILTLNLKEFKVMISIIVQGIVCFNPITPFIGFNVMRIW